MSILVIGFSSMAISCNNIKNKDEIATKKTSSNSVVKYAKGFDFKRSADSPAGGSFVVP